MNTRLEEEQDQKGSVRIDPCVYHIKAEVSKEVTQENFMTV